MKEKVRIFGVEEVVQKTLRASGSRRGSGQTEIFSYRYSTCARSQEYGLFCCPAKAIVEAISANSRSPEAILPGMTTRIR